MRCSNHTLVVNPVAIAADRVDVVAFTQPLRVDCRKVLPVIRPVPKMRQKSPQIAGVQLIQPRINPGCPRQLIAGPSTIAQ
jgi:hypothetical protein